MTQQNFDSLLPQALANAAAQEWNAALAGGNSPAPELSPEYLAWEAEFLRDPAGMTVHYRTIEPVRRPRRRTVRALLIAALVPALIIALTLSTALARRPTLDNYWRTTTAAAEAPSLFAEFPELYSGREHYSMMVLDLYDFLDDTGFKADETQDAGSWSPSWLPELPVHRETALVLSELERKYSVFYGENELVYEGSWEESEPSDNYLYPSVSTYVYSVNLHVSYEGLAYPENPAAGDRYPYYFGFEYDTEGNYEAEHKAVSINGNPGTIVWFPGILSELSKDVLYSDMYLIWVDLDNQAVFIMTYSGPAYSCEAGGTEAVLLRIAESFEKVD